MPQVKIISYRLWVVQIVRAQVVSSQRHTAQGSGRKEKN